MVSVSKYVDVNKLTLGERGTGMLGYPDILTGLIKLGKSIEQIKTGIVIGSRARTEHPADEYSDVDIVLLVEDIEFFIESDEWLNGFGKYHISFTEDSIADGKERRILFDNALDVDFIFIQANDIDRIEKDTYVTEMIGRSYRILFDKIGFEAVLQRMVSSLKPYMLPSESDFKNTACNFWFHTIWAAKKVLRGELWVAKNCVDGYMKNMLLKMIEIYSHAVNSLTYNTWHSGRFVEQWAEPWIVEEFSEIYAVYSDIDILRALFKTIELYRKLAVETAKRLKYKYPYEAERYALNYLDNIKRFRN